MTKPIREQQVSPRHRVRAQVRPVLLSAFRWEFALYAALIVLAVVLRFWELGARTFHGDEAVHAGFAWQLVDGRGYVHNPLTHGPFQFFGTALVFTLFGDSDYTARVLPALFGAALVALPFFLRGHLGRTGALIAALLLAVSPTLLYFSRFAREDVYIAFFTLALVICIWRYLAQPRHLYLYLTAALLALSFATKEVAFIIVAMLLVYLDLLVTRELMAQIWPRSLSGWLPDAAQEQKQATEEGHYAVLGLAEGASAKAIRRAYRRLQRAGRAEPDMRRIERAYEALSDARRREGNNRLLARLRRGQTEAEGSIPEKEAQRPGLRQQMLAYAVLLPSAWLIVAFWPLMESIRRRFRLSAFPRAGHLLVLIGCLSLPLCAAAVEKLPFVGDRGYNVADELLVMRVTVLTLVIAAFCVGFLWRWRVWMICAAIFHAIFILLFTSFLTNPDGFWTGIWGSLDYWMGQQYVRLGDQPSYYYFMLLPVYEFLPLVFALGAAVVYALRGERRHKAVALGALALVIVLALAGERLPLVGPYRAQVGFVTMIGVMLMLPMASFTRLLFYWTLSALFAFTLAGEKMPWLNVHIALPLSILAGRALGELLSGLEMHVELPPLRRWAPLGVASLTAALAVTVFIAVGLENSVAIAGWLLALAALAAVVWSGRSLGPQTAMRVSAGVMGAVLLVLTARAAVLSSWGHPDLLDGSGTLASRDRGDTPVEMLVYVQSSPDIPVIRDAIDAVAAASGQGVHLPVVIDAKDSYAWPWAWYLRKYENLSLVEIDEGFKPPPGSVVLVSWRNHTLLDLDPALFAEGVRYHHRWWFPEDYRGLSSAQVMQDLLDPASWESWRDYFIDRTPPSGIPALDAVAYFPRDGRYSEVLAATLHKEP